ncbi:hypothetical protein PIB30_024147 [Stylosanthes scabra]|uniref:Uncharacterized protein n=1 Tax=Stylosanthes scabra TaxID=79078 RepID=A0ABU6XBC8_9FABA|nr:hypothetical protein [Stylosanthes scabra]
MTNKNLIVTTLYPDGAETYHSTNDGRAGSEIRDASCISASEPLAPLDYKFKLLWLEGDDHVHVMFDLHCKYGPHQMMELLAETLNVVRSKGGPSSSKPCLAGAIPVPPLRITTLDISMEIDSDSRDGSDGDYMGDTNFPSDSFDEVHHFHTLNLDAMREEQRDGFGGGGKDYINLDGGEEFMVGHRFSNKKVVHLEVKNYNIRRAAEYKVFESN